MADIETVPPQSNGYTIANDDDDERGKMRPADIDDVSYYITLIVRFIELSLLHYCFSPNYLDILVLILHLTQSSTFNTHARSLHIILHVH